MKAMGVPTEEANALVRFSLGRETTLDEVQQTMALLPGLIERSRI